MNKQYLGDGVYADFDGACVILTTSDGIRELSRIYLDSHVLSSLKKYIERVQAEEDELLRLTPDTYSY